MFFAPRTFDNLRCGSGKKAESDGSKLETVTGQRKITFSHGVDSRALYGALEILAEWELPASMCLKASLQ